MREMIDFSFFSSNKPIRCLRSFIYRNTRSLFRKTYPLDVSLGLRVGSNPLKQPIPIIFLIGAYLS